MKSTHLAHVLVATLVASSLGGCSGCGSDTVPIDPDSGPPTDAGPDKRTFDQCDGDAPSFVRQAFLALDGRRPRSQSEVDAYVDLFNQAKDLGRNPSEVVARAIMQRPEFMDRWVDVIMDALHVQRLDIQSEASCWDASVRPAVTTALALNVRNKPAATAADGNTFTMLDLAKSSIALDDLTPIYRGQLFSLVSHPIPAANVGVVEAELSRRADFGAAFDASYLHRDVVCLGCHTSDSSVTDSDDELRDRHWPVPGLAEKAVYGVSNGIAIERAHAVFRVRGFVDQGNVRPWGWLDNCGTFAAPAGIANDPANIDAKLASITGLKPTVFDLDLALMNGFNKLRTGGAPTAAITDPDVGLAWLVTLKITEDVWRQATGTGLTIANYFPRNKASSELLASLAGTFVSSGFSLKSLLVAIVTSDYFNRIPPDGRCGEKPYSYPNVFDPWVISEADAEKQLNSPADAVTSLDGRTLISAVAGALDWAAPPLASRFPDYGEGCDDSTCAQIQGSCSNNGFCCTTAMAACQMNGVLPSEEVPFQRNIGLFLRNSERGFRGLDFQARLAFEDRYGACTKPRWVNTDFIDHLALAYTANPQATVRDAVVALKDRLVGEPFITAGPESIALTAIVGDLDGPATQNSVATMRRVCGAILGSPQFLLQGIAGRGGERPLLTPANANYDSVCAQLSTNLGTPGLAVSCTLGDVLTLSATKVAPPAPPVDVPAGPAPAPRRQRADPRRAPAPTGGM